MGWLGWTEEQALSADVNAIELGMRGKVAMLKAIFGGEEADNGSRNAPSPATRPLTPELFDAIF